MLWVALLLAQVPLPGTSSVSVPLGAPEACGRCHGEFDPRSAYETWVGSVMGNAGRDPWFWSALDEAEKDVPGVGDFCLRCHVPEAWLAGRCFPTNGALITTDDGGVGCSFCHRMDPTPYLRNGQYIVGDDVDLRGPYDDAQAPHRTQQGAHISTSELCGVCHDLYLPNVQRRMLDGQLTDMQFPEQTTYSEWKSSAFADEAVTCQTCHMEEDQGRVALQGPVRPDRSNHQPAGGNVFLLQAVSALYPELGISEQLNRSVARTEATLRTAAALELIAPAEADRGEPIELRIRVTNRTGHKLPTGYPEGRRVWVAASAAPFDLDRGRYDDLSGEPMSPLRVYRAEQGQASVGRAGPHLALNDTVFFDNRIPPRGFVPTTTTAPVGFTFAEVSPGVLAHYDDLTVTATVPCDHPGGDVRVDVSLWYQSVTKAAIESVLDLNGDTLHADELRFAFETADPGPLEMASVSAMVFVDSASSCHADDAGIPDLGPPDSGDTGSPRDAGQPDQGTADSGSGDEEEGCSCATSRPDVSSSASAWLMAGVLGWWTRRRRMARAGPGC